MERSELEEYVTCTAVDFQKALSRSIVCLWGLYLSESLRTNPFDHAWHLLRIQMV